MPTSSTLVSVSLTMSSRLRTAAVALLFAMHTLPIYTQCKQVFAADTADTIDVMQHSQLQCK